MPVGALAPQPRDPRTDRVGKSFLANALAHAAIRQGFRALFVRVPRLLDQLAIARVSAEYSATLERIARIDVLILDSCGVPAYVEPSVETPPAPRFFSRVTPHNSVS